MEEAGKHCTLPLLRTSPPRPADGEERPLLPHIVRVIPLPKCTDNARILLVIPFPHDMATVTALDSQGFWAFNDSICEALFSVCGE